jgi:uncharacterized membrane protein
MTVKSTQTRYPKARLDALTDGIFAVAMTLLVLDIRLPEAFQPADTLEMLQGLVEIWPKFFPYVVSFMILGLRWLSLAQVPSRSEYVENRFIRWWMFYLMMITCVPFTTIVVGRHAALAPAIWLYCGNTALIAIASWRMAVLTPGIDGERHIHQRQISMAVLLATALGCIGWSFLEPRQALWVFALNLFTPSLIRVYHLQTRVED